MSGANDKAADERQETAHRGPVKHSFMLHLTPSRGSRTRWHGQMNHLSEGVLVERTGRMAVSDLLAVLTDTIKKITGKAP